MVVLGLAVGLGLAAYALRDAPRPDLTVSPSNPVAQELIGFDGQLTTPVRRPVRLEYWTGSEWSPVAESTTQATGKFALTTRAAATSRRFRVVAPPVEGHGLQMTRARLVRTRIPKANLRFVEAPIAQSMEGATDLTPGVAHFKPIREGRPVMVQRRDRRRWRTVHRAVQDGQGAVHFMVAATDATGAAHRFRAVTAEHNGAPAHASSKVRATSGPLTWREEFDVDDPDINFDEWALRATEIPRVPGRMCSQSSAESVSVSDGVAHLLTKEITPRDPDYVPRSAMNGPGWTRKAKRICRTFGQYYNANLGSRASFKYGILAARVQFHDEDGQHGAFWSQPDGRYHQPGDVAVNGAEIDVVEYFGDDFHDGAIANLVYWKDPDGTPHKAGDDKNLNHLLGPGKTWSNSFHVFSVEWTDKRYVYRVDGHEVFRSRRGISKTPQHVILSLLTSEWELPRLDKTKLNSMQVDWVRVWQPLGKQVFPAEAP